MFYLFLFEEFLGIADFFKFLRVAHNEEGMVLRTEIIKIPPMAGDVFSLIAHIDM